MNSNEYNIELDDCGYAPSVIQTCDDPRCFHCGRRRDLQRHEVFNSAFRSKSKRLGLWIWLCAACHYDITFVHAKARIRLKAVGQDAAMKHYGWDTDDFIREFGKNYKD